MSIQQKKTVFLNLNLYQGHRIAFQKKLDKKTFQKPNDLFQYLHFSSTHPKQTYKGIVVGECMRYARTNTAKEGFEASVSSFEERLLKRDYPPKFIKKATKSVSYNKRAHFLQGTRICVPWLKPPLFSVYRLQRIILHCYKSLLLPSPRFISLKHITLHTELIRAHVILSDEQSLDIMAKFS